MSLYAHTDYWRLPKNVLADSLMLMRSDGELGREGIVFWLGTHRDGIASIEALLSMNGPGIQKLPLYMKISPDAMNTLADVAGDRGYYLVGQIHSHPGTFVDLSQADIRYGIAAPFYLSVVAPHYALENDTGWSDCGVHVFSPNAGFRRLTISQAHSVLRVDKDNVAAIIQIRG